jgi:hypothetical protein
MGVTLVYIIGQIQTIDPQHAATSQRQDRPADDIRRESITAGSEEL